MLERLDEVRAPRIGRPGLDRGEEAVESFWRHYERTGTPLRRAVTRLTELALSPEGEQSRRATALLFGAVVEPLCDAFSPVAARIYGRVFAQVIDEARRHPACREMDRRLAARGIHGEQDLLRPAHEHKLPATNRAAIGRVLLLSRLTLGADVAIALPALAGLRERFPRAELCIVGTEAARVLVRGHADVRHVAAPYGRGDSLAERLNAWPALCTAVERCLEAGCPALVVDPDSRLTQLGLLPPLEGARYFHFPSRSYGGTRAAALSELLGEWLAETFGPASGADAGTGATPPPALELCGEDAAFAAALRERLRGTDARRIASVSFGVGGNERKRAGAPFEAALLEWIAARGARVLLARGSGAGEVARTLRLAAELERRGLEVHHLPRGREIDAMPARPADLVTWEADVGAFMAAVACADVYVGYDSAGQHLAAALGVPTLSVFVESAGARHAERWRPRGAAPVRIVRSSQPPEPEELLVRTQAAFAALCPGLGARRLNA